MSQKVNPRHRDSGCPDAGMSIPLVLGALMLFSVLVFLLASVALLSSRHANWALHRTEAMAAAEAGAQDYVNRMNGYAGFDSWTAERTKRMRDRGEPEGINFPKIVRNSALAKWVSVGDSSNADYTYDIVGNSGGLIVRSTGRAGPNKETKRSVEYRITRNSDSAVSFVSNRSYVNTAAYANQAQLFKDNIGEQGGMAVNDRTGKRYTVEEYTTNCPELEKGRAESTTDWFYCWRQPWNGYDGVEGNGIVRAPHTIHEYKSYLNPARSADSKLLEVPNVTGSLTIQYSTPDNFTRPAGFWGRKNLRAYRDEEHAHWRGRDTWTYLPYDETIGSSTANFEVIRNEASTFDQCVFRGSTHVILYGDVIYVRSPHTPRNENDDKSDWCKNTAKRLYGRTKTSPNPDITKDMIRSGNFLKPADESTWVKFEGIPDTAVFLVLKTSNEGCHPRIPRDVDSVGKSTGIGFPGAPSTVSTSNPALGNLYDCKNGDLFIEGAVSHHKTFAAEDNIYLTGGIRYTDRQSNNELPINSDDMLGLVAQQNVIVYNPSPITSGACTGCNKMPRHHYFLPTREQDLSGNEQSGQGALAAYGFSQWQQGLDINDRHKKQKQNPNDDIIMNDPTSGRPPENASWLALPQYDAAIVAEEGSFFLENMNILKDRPARKSRYHNESPLKITVTGSVYSKYGPMFHIDRMPPRRGSTNVTNNPDSSQIEVYGLNMRFLFDKRFTKQLPPGFSGHSESAYRTVGYAEVFEQHLDASY